MDHIEIHIKDGICKVIEGLSRRVTFTTEESVGLALLKINPSQQAGVIKWNDHLLTRGVAIGVAGAKTYSIWVIPAQDRTIDWRRNERSQQLKVTLPACLMGTVFNGGTLGKATLWVIKPGLESKLTASLQDGCLVAWPYGNIYTHGGVCWGTTSTRDIHTPQEIEDAFFRSGFNGDLWYAGSACGVGEATLPDLVKRVGAVIPVPAATAYTKSVASMVQELGR